VYGHFTTVRVEDDGVRGWVRHETRLLHDSQAMFDIAVDLGTVRDALRSALESQPRPVVARIAVTADDFDRNRPGGSLLRVDVTCREAPAAASDGLGPVRLRPLVHRRSLASVKHLSSAPELYRRRTAQQAGYDDAVFTDADGVLAEGPTSGLAFLRGETLVLPTADVLPSTTLALLADAAVGAGGTAADEIVRLDELDRYDACVLVSAVMGIRRVASIGETAFRLDHPPVTRLSDAYVALPRTLP
jgi:branched-subunit amino acid aminotransferase/4-amino-4-deoxychorismate lyase